MGLYDGSNNLLTKTGGGTLSASMTAATPATITVEAQTNATSVTLKVSDAAGNVAMATQSVVLGTTGDDTALGGTANADFIYGFGGADTITGGAGADTLALGAADSAVDTVTYTASGETDNRTTGFFADGGSTSAMDVITEAAIGDKLKVWAGVLAGATTVSTSYLTDATTNKVAIVQGALDGSGNFTAGAGGSNDDYIVQWADGTAVHSVVLKDYGTTAPTLTADETAGTLTITAPDTTPPTVTSVAITSATGALNNTLNAGDVVSATVTMSEAITVTGTPQLALNIGGTTVQATYASGSGTTALVFTYTILTGQTDANGISIAANSLGLNGGTLQDAAGNNATLTHAAVADNASYLVDTYVPLIFDFSVSSATNLSVTSNEAGSAQLYLASDHTTAVGSSVALTPNTAASLTVAAQTTVTEAELHVKDSAGNPTSLVGKHVFLGIDNTSPAGDNITGTGNVEFIFGFAGDDTLNGGAGDDVIIGGDGSDALTGGSGANTLALGASDGVADTVTYTASGETDNRSSGFFADGSTSAMDVITQAALGDKLKVWDGFLDSGTTVSTTYLADATTNKTAIVQGALDNSGNFTAGTGGSNDDYIVQWADGTKVHSVVLKDYGTTAPTLVADAAADTLTLAVADNTAPTVTSVTVPSAKTYKLDDTLSFTVNTSENVTVTGTPQLALTLGSTTVQANYASGTGTNALVFSYTVASTDLDTDGITVGTLGLNSGTLQDAAGNAMTLTLNNVGATTGVKVDGVIPTVTTTSAAYAHVSDTLTLTGTDFSTLLEAGEDDSTDIKARLDWSKLVWDINGDDATTANVSFLASDISSAKVSSDTSLTVVLTAAKGTALEGTTGYGATGNADTLDIAAGFARDAAGNAATTDALSDGALAVTTNASPLLTLPPPPASFAAKVDYATGTSPYSVTSADVNGDGKADLVVANSSSDTVSVLTNQGDGRFNAKVDVATSADPYSISSADVNGDGKPDLLVVNSNSSSVEVLLNEWYWTCALRPTVHYPTGSTTLGYPTSVASADVNRDGYPDLLVTNSSHFNVAVLMNKADGSGTFKNAVHYDTGAEPTHVSSADINGDGHPDLLVANRMSNTVSVLTNTGSGTFNAKVDFATGFSPSSVTSADVNGDGKADLLVANYYSHTVSVLTNQGDGRFNAKVDVATGSPPSSVTSADVNSDGKPDLLVANLGSNTVSVYTNTSGFTEQTPVALNSALTLSDADGDADWNGGTLEVQISANADMFDLLRLPTSSPDGKGVWLGGLEVMVDGVAIAKSSVATMGVNGNSPWTFTFNAIAPAP